MHEYSPAGYVGLLTILNERARKLGYALGLHGSLTSDMDVMAVPWTEWACPAADLVDGLAKSINLDPSNSLHGPEEKPHGRLAWTLALGAGARIDLSVMQTETMGWVQQSTLDRTKALLEEAKEDNRIKADALDIKREEIQALRKEISQRKGWQHCPTHNQINADSHWGCPDCVRELRLEVNRLVELSARHIAEWGQRLTEYEQKNIEQERIIDGLCSVIANYQGGRY